MGIVVKDICKRFGDFVAVDHVNFRVEEGELVALLGPSGSGKSTILRLIAGLETPDTGEIFLTGKRVTSMATQKRGVGFVFQHYALFKHMTAEKNIAFGLEIQKRPTDEIRRKVRELVALVRLEGYEHHYPDQLSGGQRQRVALARALATEPHVLLLDEPFGALDAKVRDNLAQWLREFHEKLHITSIFVTHDQSEAIEICDKVVVINKGRVEQMGTAKEVYEHPRSKFVASFIGEVNIIDATVAEGRVRMKDMDLSLNTHQDSPPEDGDAVLLVRPEDLLLLDDGEVSEGVTCIIKDIHYRGSHFEIDCDLFGKDVRVVENKTRFFEKKWHKKMDASLAVQSYRLFSVEEGHEQIHEQLQSKGFVE